MAHHGWVPVEDPDKLTPDGLKSPFGRLFPAENIAYDSLGISLFAGPDGPLGLKAPQPGEAGHKAPNPAGFTFFGQFVDHDLTEFRVIGEGNQIIPSNPTIGQRQKVLEDLIDPVTQLPTTTNGRSGRLDLDSVYGLLGNVQTDLFDADGLFVHEVVNVGEQNLPPDFKRGAEYRNNRLIADPRNDENKLIAQIHLLFERLHNKIHADKRKAKPDAPAEDFAPFGGEFNKTRDQVAKIYRQIVIFDYLPRIVRPAQIRAVLEQFTRRKTFIQDTNARNDAILERLGIGDEAVKDAVTIPVEFSHAVFRLGHTQLRDGYQLAGSIGLTNDPAFVSVPLFRRSTGFAGKPWDRDLRGDEQLYDGTANFHVDWPLFFKLSNAEPQGGEGIDTHLPSSIFRLPPPAIGEPPQSLAERNIRRGVDFGLPGGQSVARQLAQRYGFIATIAEVFPKGVFGPGGSFPEVLKREPRLRWDTPLWYYVLREAELAPDTPQLGAVGGYIVAETLLCALLEAEVTEPDLGRRSEAIAIAAQAWLGKFDALNVDWQDTGPADPRHYTRPLASADSIISLSQLIVFVS